VSHTYNGVDALCMQALVYSYSLQFVPVPALGHTVGIGTARTTIPCMHIAASAATFLAVPRCTTLPTKWAHSSPEQHAGW